MSDDDIEIGEEVDVEVLVDGDGEAVGAVVDDIVVATGPDGSIVDETIDVLDADGHLILEDEKVSVYDADAHLIAQDETMAIALETESEAESEKE
jgi:hypothetical protein